jgi:hypothetical protein
VQQNFDGWSAKLVSQQNVLQHSPSMAHGLWSGRHTGCPH